MSALTNSIGVWQRMLHSVASAIAALRANKGRSALTALGIIIGVAAVIAMLALAESASAGMRAQLSGLGANVLAISPGTPQSSGARAVAGSLNSLKAGDVDAIVQSIHGVSAASAVLAGNTQVISGNENWATRVEGVMPAYLQIEDWHVAQGTFFTTQDNTDSRNVAVIGQTVASSLFASGTSPLGQVIRVRNVPFTVIGVLASKGGGFGADQDDVVLIPLQTGQVRLFGGTSINQIVLQVSDGVDMGGVMQRLEPLLRQRQLQIHLSG